MAVGGGILARVSRPTPVPDPDLDAEREVDLRSVWERISARWWLPLAGLLLGLVVGFLLALGGGTVYRAEALLFLGQPFTPQGGGQIQSLATNPRTVGEIIRSESALRAAARESGLTVSQLRGNVASTPITTAGQSRLQTPLVEVSVKGNAPAKVAAAANALAERVVERVSLYVEDKVQVLEDQIANDNRELEQINTRIARATQQQTEILENEELSASERLLLLTNINSTIGFAEQRRGTVQEDLLQARQLLSLATRVEQSSVIEPAVSAKTTARSGRNAALVGGLIGLLLGCAAALLADPFLARRAQRV
jgi:capsular polysaccharide biosynthesis protein